MNIEKIDKLSKETAEFQKEIKLKKEVLKLIKDEEIKNYYINQKEETLALDEDFQNININGVILQERKNVTYSWSKDFYEEVIGCGIVHTLLKHGDKLKERFNLSDYVLPKDPENKTLGLVPYKKSVAEAEFYMINLDIEKQKWSANGIEQVVENYMRLKKIIDLKEERYSSMKNELLQLMKEHNVQKTEEGFYLKDEIQNYDFAEMYNAEELEETVIIATNGIHSVDLFHDKEIVMIDITEDDLYDVEYIKKRFGKKRIDALKTALGEDFYYVKGYRKETNILSRFPVSTEKVEEAIDNKWLPMNILKTGRQVKSVDDIKLNFEIVSEESAKKRAEINYQKFMNRALIQSGYYENN